jgi:hypothetical protein
MNTDLRNKLESLKQRDADTRNRLLKKGRLYGEYNADMQAVHLENAIALNKLVAIHGWPGISLVGLEGSRAAWLVAQHAICTPGLQRKFLRLLRAAAESGEVPRKQVAFLTDRIRFNEGKPQVYGTVLDWDKNGELGCELENPDQVDERRATVGLPPFQESLRAQKNAIEAEGGIAPSDFAAYKQAANEWAKNVGWR